MSVRRLSPVQPDSFEFSADTMEKALWWMAKYPPERKQSAVIPILWLVQKQDGWVSEPAIRAIADLCGMPKIRVLEVATFYTMFQLVPVGSTALIQVCGTTPCMLRGSEALMEVCKAELGPRDHISPDGKFTWQEVECLGACANAPMAQINDYYFEDLTPDSLKAIIEAFRKGEQPAPGSAIGRVSSEPVGGAMTLSDPSLYDGSRAAPIARLPNTGEPEA